MEEGANLHWGIWFKRETLMLIVEPPDKNAKVPQEWQQPFYFDGKRSFYNANLSFRLLLGKLWSPSGQCWTYSKCSGTRFTIFVTNITSRPMIGKEKFPWLLFPKTQMKILGMFSKHSVLMKMRLKCKIFFNPLMRQGCRQNCPSC